MDWGMSFDWINSPHVISQSVEEMKDTSVQTNLEFEEKTEFAEASIKLENEKLMRENQKLVNDFNPIFGNLTVPSNSREAVITRLSSLYEDPNYGPGYFKEYARILKQMLIIYKDVKVNSNCDLFFLNKTKTGIHIQFNTVTGKREVVIPVGRPGMDPVRIDIGMFRSWYKKQRMAAIAARIKAQEEIREMRRKVAQAALDQAKSYLETCQAEVAVNKALRSLKSRGKREKFIGIDMLSNLDEIRERLQKVMRKPKEDFLSLKKAIKKLEDEKGMYEEKFFLEKMLEVLVNAEKKSNNVRDIYSSFTEEVLLLQNQ